MALLMSYSGTVVAFLTWVSFRRIVPNGVLMEHTLGPGFPISSP